jgi:hypothetical protein
MTASNDNNLYREVVDVTTSYLGPAAERFISRQIQTHLHKSPDELLPEDIEKLSEWVKVAIALLTEDSKMVDDFTQSLIELASNDRQVGV